jgi:hypothetical protein
MGQREGREGRKQPPSNQEKDGCGCTSLWMRTTGAVVGTCSGSTSRTPGKGPVPCRLIIRDGQKSYLQDTGDEAIDNSQHLAEEVQLPVSGEGRLSQCYGVGFVSSLLLHRTVKDYSRAVECSRAIGM